jgi:hypothetical protein
MDPELMEMLQILKYTFRKERLDPMQNMFVFESDMLEDQNEFEPEYIDGLVAQGRISELLSIIEGRPCKQ